MQGEDRDARRVADHFERLARAAAPSAADHAGDPAEAELETAVALLAFALEPERPRPELRDRLLAALPPRGPASLPAVLAPAMPAPAALLAQAVASPILIAPVIVTAGVQQASVVDLAEFARREKRVVTAVRLLVAALLLCLVGVVYLTARLDRQGAELQRQSAELDTVGRRMHMITSVARYAYRLESVPATPVASFFSPEAPPQGMVYVCGQHKQWILSLEHLPPPPPGREYHIQFRTDSGVIDGGVLRVDAMARAGMEDVKLPPGTRGFSVTLEPVDTPGDPLLVLQSQPGVPL